MSKEHDCLANLASTRNDLVLTGTEVYEYRDCTECGDEFMTTYEYVGEVVPEEEEPPGDFPEHDCGANLAENENELSKSGGEITVYRDCKVCGREFSTTHEYVETTLA